MRFSKCRAVTSNNFFPFYLFGIAARGIASSSFPPFFFSLYFFPFFFVRPIKRKIPSGHRFLRRIAEPTIRIFSPFRFFLTYRPDLFTFFRRLISRSLRKRILGGRVGLFSKRNENQIRIGSSIRDISKAKEPQINLIWLM